MDSWTKNEEESPKFKSWQARSGEAKRFSLFL